MAGDFQHEKSVECHPPNLPDPAHLGKILDFVFFFFFFFSLLGSAHRLQRAHRLIVYIHQPPKKVFQGLPLRRKKHSGIYLCNVFNGMSSGLGLHPSSMSMDPPLAWSRGVFFFSFWASSPPLFVAAPDGIRFAAAREQRWPAENSNIHLLASNIGSGVLRVNLYTVQRCGTAANHLGGLTIQRKKRSETLGHLVVALVIFPGHLLFDRAPDHRLGSIRRPTGRPEKKKRPRLFSSPLKHRASRACRC